MVAGTTYYLTDYNSFTKNKHFPYWKIGGTTLVPPVVQQLYIKNHDIHSIRIILSTFDHPSVFRLREAWRMFRVQKPKFYRALKYLWNVLSQENNWDDYHSWLEQKFIKDCLNKNQPMLLFIGYVLSKMINDHFRYYQISNHNKNKKSSRVNMTLIEYIKSSPKHYK
ncbi:unnamed protein product [Rotaria sp. Silwood2]|nr:unnamed protein product [Rotaria sp. Silwood2]